jgi:hypothetical protein
MVPLDTPIDPSKTVGDVLEYLERNGFDLALLDDREVRVVYRDDLRHVPSEKHHVRVRGYSASPRANRLVEHSLDLGEVAERLIADRTPLLVVGRNGPEYIVTEADFTRPAGQAGIIAVIAVMDAELDAFLRPHDHEVWAVLTSKRRREIESLVDRARRRDAEVPRLGYLTLTERLELVRRLRLDRRYGIELGAQVEHELVVSIRNDIAHGREVRDGSAAMKALACAERYLDRLDTVDGDSLWADFQTSDYLARLMNAELRTLSGRPNRILDLDDDDVLVATMRSPEGRRVPKRLVSSAIERLLEDGEIEIDVRTVGYRSAFVGAVLVTLPGASVDPMNTRVIRREGFPVVAAIPSP